jgi:hypothetical protein
MGTDVLLLTKPAGSNSIQRKKKNKHANKHANKNANKNANTNKNKPNR